MPNKKNAGIESLSLEYPMFSLVVPYSGELPDVQHFSDTELQISAYRPRIIKYSEKQTTVVGSLAIRSYIEPTFFLHQRPLEANFQELGGNVNIGLDILSLRPLKGLIVPPTIKAELKPFNKQLIDSLFEDSDNKIKDLIVFEKDTTADHLEFSELAVQSSIGSLALMNCFKNAMASKKMHDPKTINNKIKEISSAIPDKSKVYSRLYSDISDVIGVASILRHFYKRKDNLEIWQRLEAILEKILERKTTQNVIAKELKVTREETEDGIKKDINVTIQLQKYYKQRKIKK